MSCDSRPASVTIILDGETCTDHGHSIINSISVENVGIEPIETVDAIRTLGQFTVMVAMKDDPDLRDILEAEYDTDEGMQELDDELKEDLRSLFAYRFFLSAVMQGPTTVDGATYLSI